MSMKSPGDYRRCLGLIRGTFATAITRESVATKTLDRAILSKGPPNHHSQSTLRPPLPPPHNHTLSHHHSSANSLNRNSLTNRRSQIHAPAPAPNDLATTPESVQLQDSWVLNSNVPLETRHFLFKTSSGSTPLFSSSSPGYPLTSGTVYTPPPRLLPRNTFSRKAFKLKKPSKYCSWKCAALSAIAAALLLAILLAYFIGKSSSSFGKEDKAALALVLTKLAFLLPTSALLSCSAVGAPLLS
ncbi:hypothetical protein ACRRTK_006569 [Alexandromys fortis]